jgi:hypothetical protein
VLGLLVALPYAIPNAQRFRLLTPKVVEEERTTAAASDSASAPVGETKLVEETSDRPELALPPPAPNTADDQPSNAKPSPLPVEDPSGHALDGFFASLSQTEKKQGHTLTRILHYGDSLLAVDFVSSTIRRKFQERFGDGGHGYMPVANPTTGYFHNDVIRRASTDWTVSRVVGPFAADSLYGLGGVTFTGTSRSSWAHYGTTSKPGIGGTASVFAVQYLEQPGGGSFEVVIDKDQTEVVSTDGPEKKLKTFVKTMPDVDHGIDLRVVKGPVRAFGTWLERDTDGVVLDSVGIQGARLRFLDQNDDDHWKVALQTRNPNLVIFEFGLNEVMDDFAYPMDKYKETAIAVLRQAKQALPNGSCLVVSLNDVAVKKGTVLVTRGVTPHLVKAQREAAYEAGCAFYDTYKAMGGSGSMAIWYARGMGQPDYTHPTITGADLIGNWIYSALMDRYRSYRSGGAGSVSSASASATASASAPIPTTVAP